MSWFRVDDKFHSHEKAAIAGYAAIGAWTLAGSWSSDHLTDGRVPSAVAHRFAPKKVWAKLIEARLVEEVDGGYQIHDFLDRNPSAEEVKAERAERSRAKQDAGRIGGLRSGEARRAKRAEAEADEKHTIGDDEADGNQTPSRREAGAKQTGSRSEADGKQERSRREAGAKQIEAPIPSRSRPDPVDSHTHTGERERADGRTSGRAEVDQDLVQAGPDVEAIFAELDACELFRRSAALTELGAGKTLLAVAQHGAGLRISSGKPLQAYIDAAREAAAKLTAECAGEALPPRWAYLGGKIGSYFMHAGKFNAPPRGRDKPAKLITQPRRDTYEVPKGMIDD